MEELEQENRRLQKEAAQKKKADQRAQRAHEQQEDVNDACKFVTKVYKRNYIY